jgi:hypothetical protein
LAWVRGPIQKAQLEILTYGGPRDGRPNPWENIRTPDPQKKVSIVKNQTYMLKSSSVSLGGEKSRFKVKLWKQSDDEPAEWGVQADIDTRKGSVFVTAYNGDVTFGDVVVKGAGTSQTTPVQVQEDTDSSSGRLGVMYLLTLLMILVMRYVHSTVIGFIRYR